MLSEFHSQRSLFAAVDLHRHEINFRDGLKFHISDIERPDMASYCHHHSLERSIWEKDSSSVAHTSPVLSLFRSRLPPAFPSSQETCILISLCLPISMSFDFFLALIEFNSLLSFCRSTLAASLRITSTNYTLLHYTHFSVPFFHTASNVWKSKRLRRGALLKNLLRCCC